MCFFYLLLVSLFSVVQIKPFSPSQSHSETESIFRFSLKIFIQPAVAGGPRKFIFMGPRTPLSVPDYSHTFYSNSSTFITCVVRCIPQPIKLLSLNRLFMRNEHVILVQPRD